MPPVSVTMQGPVALVTIANPPVNALSQSVRQGIVDAMDSAEEDPKCKAIVVICEGRTFIAGADIREFGKTPETLL